MEHPEHDIRPIVRSLCQGTVDEQRRTLDRYFTKDASFVHPFCYVPHFNAGAVSVPFVNRIASRDVVRSIFQWYRMLSPKIDIEIDSALHDRVRDKMYLDIRQTFSIWFIPGYHANVRLVTVLHLVANDDANYHDPLDRLVGQDAEVTDEARTPVSDQHSPSTDRDQHTPSTDRGHHHDQRVWMISCQEDLYQVNDFLKFLGGAGPLPFLWLGFQMFASFMCVLLSLGLPFAPWALQDEPARGGVEAVIKTVEKYSDAPPRGKERMGSNSESEHSVAAAAGGGSDIGSAAGTSGGKDSGSGERGGAVGGGDGTATATGSAAAPSTNGGSRRGSGSTNSKPPKKSWKSSKKNGAR